MEVYVEKQLNYKDRQLATLNHQLTLNFLAIFACNMVKVAVFGGTGMTGLCVIRSALEKGENYAVYLRKIQLTKNSYRTFSQTFGQKRVYHSRRV